MSCDDISRVIINSLFVNPSLNDCNDLITWESMKCTISLRTDEIGNKRNKELIKYNIMYTTDVIILT